MVEAAAEQMKRLPYATGFFHFGSEPAIELAAKEAKVAARLAKAGYENGLLFRAFGADAIGLAPPICITKDEVGLLISRLRATIDAFGDLQG